MRLPPWREAIYWGKMTWFHRKINRAALLSKSSHVAKLWPTDKTVPGSIPSGASFNYKRYSIEDNLSLSPSHRPDMTEMLLKRTYRVIHRTIHLTGKI